MSWDETIVSEDSSKLRQWASDHLSVKRVWSGTGADVPLPPVVVHEELASKVAVDMAWSQERIQAAESIWGEGYIMPGPGGAKDMLSLTRPLNLTSESSLLLMGAGSGGPAQTLVSSFGARVTTVEANQQLAALANTRLARAPQIASKVTPLEWLGPLPAIRPQAFDRSLALWPLRGEADPSALLARLFRSLRPWGQIVLVEMIADMPLDPADPVVAGWSLLERRSPLLPSEADMGKMLKAQGMNIKRAEDVSEQHAKLALSGWDAAVRAMQDKRPTRSQAARLVSEAELWLLRLRLLQEKRIRVMTWHAFSRG